jgi:hypothetical protein
MAGSRLLRCAIEPSNNPTIDYYTGGEALDEFELADRNSFIFRWAAIVGAKRYLLAQHRDYYKTFDKEPYTIKQCNRDGSSSLIPNPNYVEPMFALSESEEIQCFNYISNPENVGRDPEDPIQPPLNTGQETYNRVFIDVLPSQNTLSKFATFSSDLPKEDKYITYTSTFTAQEPGFSTIAEQTSTSESTGVPPVHTRKPDRYQLDNVEDPVNNNNIIYRAKNKKPTPYRYIVYTDPFTGTYPREGSVGFEKAKNIQDVVKGVENQLKISDMRDSLTSSCTVPINVNMRTGDICIFNIGGIQYKRRIMSLNHQFIIDGVDNNGVPNLINGGTSLSLGVERPINVNYKQEKIPKNLRKEFAFEVYTNGLTLGSLLPKQTRTRGNYYEQP